MAQHQDGPAADLIGKAAGRLAWLVPVARAVMVLERWLPLLVSLAALLSGFAGLAWLGAFSLLPSSLSWLPPFGLFIGILWIIWRSGLPRSPAQSEVLARLDAETALSDRPASSFMDQQADLAGAAQSQWLWQIHRQRLAERVTALTSPSPAVDLASGDPFALRHAGFLLLAMGFLTAGDARGLRLLAAVVPHISVEAALVLREDGWIDPPAYTQIPPVMLAFNTPAHLNQVVKAPVGSKLVVRRSDGSPIKADWQGGLSQDADPNELRLVLAGDGRVVLHLQGGRDVTLQLTAIPDQPPVVALTEPPKADRKEGLGISYRWQDDYGIASGAVEIVGAINQDLQVETHPPLLPLPLYPLGFGPDPRKGENKARLPLEDPIWGGVEVEARIRVRDDAGQLGESEPFRFKVPQRSFAKPLARALVEQRRGLIVNPSQALKIREAVLALMIAPELFTPKLAHYMGLERIEQGLVRKRRQSADQYVQQLIETADLMWAMAIAIEEEGLSGAEQALQAAQNALREAMERGASPEELKQLTEELRRAMDRAMRELAEKLQNQPQDQQSRIDPRSMQMITPRDLKNLMDRMEEAMRRGDMAEAQRLLEQLKNITRNMQAARPRSQQQSEMDKALDDLDQMTREQQDLRDRTFREGQQGRNQDQKKQLQDLEKNQQALRERLESTRRAMRNRGADQQEFGEAEDAMRDAEGALGQGKDGEAVEAQGRALEALRKGGESLSQQMQQQRGNGMGEGEGTGDPDQLADGPDSSSSGDQQADGQGRGDRDPLGRPRPNNDAGDRAKLNDDGSRTAAEERARSLIEELRRRMGEVARPQAEIDYLQRLLKDNGLR